MSPRRSDVEARRTRQRLVAEATAMASTDGLDGVTVGRLADAAGLSKSGVTRHFSSKQALQLEALHHALDLFATMVWAPPAEQAPGRRRLLAICAAWTQYLASDVFPGGCFLTAASSEFDGRQGPVRDAIEAALTQWLSVLAAEIRTAVAAGELRDDTDPDLLAYELNAFALAANQARQLRGDQGAPARSLQLMRRAILQAQAA